MASARDVKCVPMNCRGMELLGFSSKATVYFCVHQVAVELWKLYDTPRVSIQKKIQDLRIRLEACSKIEIKLLRAQGIIDNFRATMIMLEDAERLFDALEHSRKKRGLVKHALTAKCHPSQRAQRSEEQRAVKLGQRVRPATTHLVCEEPRRINQGYGDELTRCAINRRHQRNAAIPRTLAKTWCWDTLSFADDVEQVRDVCDEYEHQIQVISNTVQVAGEATEIQNSCVEIERMEYKLQTDSPDASTASADSLDAAASLHDPLKSPGCSDTQSLKSHPSIQSPVFESSEFDEQASCYSVGKTSSRENSTTSDRFLLLDSASEEEEEEEGIGSDSDVFIVESPHRDSQASSPLQGIKSPVEEPLPVKRVIATRLCHFAKHNTSPLSHKCKHLRPDSLTVSIPLSAINNPSMIALKQRVLQVTKPTALSSFAMKKRAMTNSSSPSTPSESSSVASESGSDYELPSTHRESPSTSQTVQVQPLPLAKHRIGLRSRGKTMPSARIPSPQPIVTRASTLRSSVSSIDDITVTSDPNPASHSLVSDNVAGDDSSKRQTSVNAVFSPVPPRLPVLPRALPRNGVDPSTHHVTIDDDQISLASFTSSSNSSNSTNISLYSSTPSHQGRTNGVRGGRKNGKKILSSSNPLNRLKSTISFEELFNFYPPKLVVCDGELQPERSLSIKRLERQGVTSLPQTHPFLKWSLGQPVKNGGRGGKKRKV